MTQHHPSPEILAEYASGALHAGAMLVVACHIESCAVCRSEVALWEGAAGALLESSTTVALSEGALERMLTKFEEWKLRPVIDSVHSFEDAPKAYSRLEEGGFGKIVIRVRQ